MPQLPFVTVDVFTTKRFAGNPLAVVRVPPNHDISTEQMQTIAREFNLSETTFLFPDTSPSGSGSPEHCVRIFLTNTEVPFAGHPTIGTAYYAFGTLANNAPSGKLICNAGPIEVSFNNGVSKASIPHNVHVHTQNQSTLEMVYKVQPQLRDAGIKPKAINVVSPVRGMNFVCVELADLDALGKLALSGFKPQPELDDEWQGGFAAGYWYVVLSDPTKLETERTGEEAIPVARLRTRMLEASFEDPATGSGACGMTSFLAMKWKVARKIRFEVTQAVEMGRQSDIGIVVTLNEGMDAVEKVELSGIAVKVMEGVVEYD